jgi:hypothetical protein
LVLYKDIYLKDDQKSLSVGVIIQKTAAQVTFHINTLENVQKFKCFYLQEEILNYDA